MKFARNLPCNHKFHLICLSRWIEKGHKSCPICRKDINIDTIENNNNQLNRNGNNNQQQQNSIWTIGFRLNSRMFSWLPNINLRIIRG